MDKKKTGPAPKNTSRDENIKALYGSPGQKRMSLQKIADQFGISRQRVHQIVKGQV